MLRIILGGIANRHALVLDSGSSINVYNGTLPISATYTVDPVHITMGDGSHYVASEMGVNPTWGAGLIVPTSPVNLISFKFAENYYKITYDGEDSLVFNLKHRTTGKEFETITQNNLPIIVEKVDNQMVYIAQVIDRQVDKAWQLHRALDHPYTPYLVKAIKSGFFKSWNLTVSDIHRADLTKCIACRMGKMDSRKSEEPATAVQGVIGEHVHADILFINHRNEKLQYLIVVENETNFVRLIRLKTKGFEELSSGLSRMKGYFGVKRMYVHTDDEGNFKKAKGALEKESIYIVQVAAYVHEKVVERMVRTVRNKMRSTLLGLTFRLPGNLYSALAEHIAGSLNLVPNSKTGDVTPWSLVHKGQREQPVLYSFGEVGLFHDKSPKSKFDARGTIGIYIGRSDFSSGVRGFILDTKREMDAAKFEPIEISHRIIAVINALADKEPLIGLDSIFGLVRPNPLPVNPYLNVDEISQTADKILKDSIGNLDAPRKGLETWDHRFDESGCREAGRIDNSDVPRKGLEAWTDRLDESRYLVVDNYGGDQSDNFPRSVTPLVGREEPPRVLEPVESTSTLSTDAPMLACPHDLENRDVEGVHSPSENDVELRRAVSVDYVRDNVEGPSPSQKEDVESNSGMKPDVEGVYTTKSGRRTRRYNYAHQRSGVFYLATSSLLYSFFNEEVEITKANEVELEQMEMQKVWNPVRYEDVPHHLKRRIIPSKMFTVMKQSPTGEFLKYKSRLVAGGHREYLIAGFDTSSPTVLNETMMTILNLATLNDWDINTHDVRGAFLEADLSRDDVYLWLEPAIAQTLVSMDSKYEEFLDQSTGKLVVHLKKAMYGLKEASMEWYLHLVEVLKELDYKTSNFDSAMMYKIRDGRIHILLLYVDDILSTGDSEMMHEVTKHLEKRFNAVTTNSNRDEIHYLGIVIRRDRHNRSMFLFQPGFIKKILEECKIGENETANTPCNQKLLDEDVEQTLDDEDYLTGEEITQYKSDVMKLMYLTRTRPDIKLGVAFLSTKMSKPTKRDQEKLKRIFAYINGSRDLGLRLSPETTYLHCSVDASFASHSDMKGQTGICIWLGGNEGMIYSASKKQKLVTKSSTEAELVALTSAMEEVLWLRGLLEELGYPQPSTKIEQDNKSTILLANRGPGRAGRARSINIRYFWIHQHVQDKSVELKYVPSADLIADGFTKPIIGKDFKLWRSKVLNMERFPH